MATKMKTCTRCGKRKPLSGFSKDASKRDGIRNYCKECASEMNRKAVNEEVAKRKTAGQVKLDEETKVAIIMISRLIKSVVLTIADNFGMNAEVMVKLHRKGSK